MANKYLVISPNGYGNIGDDICAFSGRYAIEQADPKAEVIISRPPMNTRLVEWADYVILSGGGILYDRAPKNVDNYMSYIDKANELGKKSAVMGVGVQGIVTEQGKKRYQSSLAKCEFVSVRTDEDKKLLADIGFKSAKTTFDIAFFTTKMAKMIKPGFNVSRTYKSRRLELILERSTKPKIGICMINLKMLKRQNYGGNFKRFDEAVESFASSANKDFDVFFIQHAKEDGRLMKSVAKKTKATFVSYRDINDLPKIVNLYQNLDLMIGVRLHSIALGMMYDVPTIGIGSSNAKQLRLANYALPTLNNQFYTFEDVAQLENQLSKILKTKQITQAKLSSKEKDFIRLHNQANVELLRQMI